MQLFDSNDRLTHLGLEINHQFIQVISHIFDQYSDLSARELAIVAHLAINEVEYERILERAEEDDK